MSYVIKVLARLLAPVVRHILRDLLQAGTLVPEVSGRGPCAGCDCGGECPRRRSEPVPAPAQVVARVDGQPTEGPPQVAGEAPAEGVISVPVHEVIERVGLIAAVLKANRVPVDVTTILALRKVHNDIVSEVTSVTVKAEEPALVRPDNGKVH